MQIKYTIDLNDIITFNEYVFVNSKSIKKTIFVNSLIIALAPLIVVLAQILIYRVPFNESLPYFVPVLLFVSVPIYFLMPVFYKKKGLKNVRKLYSEGENKSILGEHELFIENEGLREKTQHFETTQSWGSIEKIVTYKTWTYIFVSAVQAYIIPQQAIVAGDYEAFLAELHSKFQEHRA